MKLSIVTDSFFLRFAGLEALLSVCLRLLFFFPFGAWTSVPLLVDSRLVEVSTAGFSGEIGWCDTVSDTSGRDIRGCNNLFKSWRLIAISREKGKTRMRLRMR